MKELSIRRTWVRTRLRPSKTWNSTTRTRHGSARTTTGEESRPSQRIRHFKRRLRDMKKNLLAIAILLLGLSPALAQDVRYDFDKEKDFSKYKTYKWVPIKGADQPDDLTVNKIKASVDAELSAKGLT